jgi:glutaminyl-peptide cyclotransferase
MPHRWRFRAAGAAFFTIALATSLQADPPPIEKWSGERAMADIAAQLKFAPRSIGTPGHEDTILLIEAVLARTGVKAERQSWIHTSADGAQLRLVNIVARFNRENPRRIIIGTHYDSLVRAYRDAEKPTAPMPGANNSASGVAVLLETARVLSELPALPIGVDFVFFDGEEGPKALGAGDPDWRALGSPYFAEHLDAFYSGARPEKSVIFDMVCYKDLSLNPDLSSLEYAKPEVIKYWEIGRSIAPSVFRFGAVEAAIGDDHTALAAVGIPSFLVIDFKYEPWFNTTKDTIDKCSARSLEAVGRTLLKYLYAQ